MQNDERGMMRPVQCNAKTELIDLPLSMIINEHSSHASYRIADATNEQ
jgi:hypothetical protein